MPWTHWSANTRDTAASSRIDSNRLRAITGSITLSSKLPIAPTKRDRGVVADHLGAHLLHRLGDDRVDLARHDRRTRLQVGDVDLGEPGVGPLPIHRMSFAILMSETAITRHTPDASTSASRAPCASKWSCASVSGSCMSVGELAMTRRANLRGQLMPVPTAVPPSGSSPTRGKRGLDALDAVLDRLRVAAELLAERDGRGVHEVGAPGLHDRRNRRCFRRSSFAEVLERGDQILRQLPRRREVDRRREHVVRRLRRVHVVVRVHAAGRATPTPAGRAPRSCSCSTTCPTRSGRRRSGSGRRGRLAPPRRRRRGSLPPCPSG